MTNYNSILFSKAGVILLLCFFVCVQILSAQNLVPNNGFEEFSHCPGSHSQHPAEFRAVSWTSATNGTPDLFNRCSVGEADVPHNWAGVSEAYEGGGYAGIYLWTDYLNYREYLQCQLTSPLIKDSTYIIEFHYRLSSYSMYAVNQIGLHFADSLVKIKTDKVVRISPAVLVRKDSVLTPNTGLWESIHHEYKATGGERFVMIGNFMDDFETKSYRLQFIPVQQVMLKAASYYYIDNVLVEPKYTREKAIVSDLAPEFVGEDVVVNKTYVLKNINFEFNSYKLSYASTETLDQLVLWLEKHPKLHLVLGGHTDDVGSDQFNLTLSKNRARTVAGYLVGHGIDKTRITHNGFGEQRPLLEETTEVARKINRRVEVKFLD
ncbi:OmpA family protein [Pseudochryseolinea flava]|uniref:OmpA family protein n=1 Tax=Pseudochryseolinea flava TaxID=2059302 RepID=UPI00140255AC|nr:OmpA family protein [Pseudochryseolinea flava]